jgi:hypothetical protein
MAFGYEGIGSCGYVHAARRTAAVAQQLAYGQLESIEQCFGKRSIQACSSSIRALYFSIYNVRRQAIFVRLTEGVTEL